MAFIHLSSFYSPHLLLIRVETMLIFFLLAVVSQLLKYNLEKKTSELVRKDFPLVQIVDRGWVGVRKFKGRMKEWC